VLICFCRAVTSRNRARQITHREDIHFRPRHECSDRQSLTRRGILNAPQQNRNGIMPKGTPRRATYRTGHRHPGACETTIICDRLAARAINRANGASKSGCRLASGSLRIINAGGRGETSPTRTSRRDR
jgi:hypothetical protein